MNNDRSMIHRNEDLPATTAEFAAAYAAPWRHVRPSSIALACALTLALGGLYAIDRWVADMDRIDARVKAAESAARIQGQLAVYAEALQSLRALYADSGQLVRGNRGEVSTRSMADFPLAFHWVWTATSEGRVDQQYSPAQRALPRVPLRLDTLKSMGIAEALQLARNSMHIQFTLPSGGFDHDTVISIVVPLVLENRLIGFGGGAIDANVLVNGIPSHQVLEGGRIAIVGGVPGNSEAPEQSRVGRLRDTSYAPFRVPGGAVWRVAVVHDPQSHTLRFMLWGVGLATLLALVVSLLHERRQGIRLAERSAELERLSAELLRANRAKSEFLANVSHELRTPLNAIVGFVDLLRDGVYGELGNRQIGPVDRIASSANHLRQLVDQVLDLAKMAAGRLEFHPEPLNLHSFVLDVASEIEALVSERGLNFSVAVSPTLPRVRTDPMHLRQILVNLLGNAVKFTPTGGVAVRAHVVSDASELPQGARLFGRPSGSSWMAVQVADSGIGIALLDRVRIFDEFEQVNPGPRGDSARRGTGLGLPISRRLARLLGGDVTVESEVGRGSTFTVWLPLDSPATGSGLSRETASPSITLDAGEQLQAAD
jgi:signal transduction histidine kinase